MTDQINYAKEYDNSGRVPNADILIKQYASDAATFRKTHPMIAEYDVAYGDKLRTRMDIYWPHTDAGKKRESPLALFIHGGYWQRMDRSSFSHMSKGLLAHGIAVAMPSYTLCPQTTISGIIIEMQRACLILYQKYQRQMTVVGHSAGGHLAACMMATDWRSLNSGLPDDLVASGMGISGLYDLMPLLQTPVNNAVRMNAQDAIDSSPIKWVPNGLNHFDAWVGGDESDEYHRQSRELAERWSLMGTPTKYKSEPKQNHFTVIDALTDPKSEMVSRIVELIETQGAELEIPVPTEDVTEKPKQPSQEEEKRTQNGENEPPSQSEKANELVAEEASEDKSSSEGKVQPKDKSRKKRKPDSKTETVRKSRVSKKKNTAKRKKSDPASKAKTTPQKKT